MNITLLGHHDIASLFALDRLIGLLPQHQYTVFLSSSPLPTTDTTSSLDSLARVDAELCERLLSGELGAAMAEELVEPHLTYLEKPNSQDGLRLLRKTDPDLIVSIRYRRILHDDAIGIPRLGVINLHSGILPDYRGVMATFWAMLNCEAEIGTTLHWITDAGIDTGPIIGVQRIGSDPQRSYLANVLGLYVDGCEMLAGAIAALGDDGPLPTGQQETAGQYYHAPVDADVDRFEKAGLNLVDGREGAWIRAAR